MEEISEHFVFYIHHGDPTGSDWLFKQMKGRMVEIGNNREIIVMGGPLELEILSMESLVNDNGERLIEFYQNNDLKIILELFKYKTIHKYVVPSYPTIKIHNSLRHCAIKHKLKDT